MHAAAANMTTDRLAKKIPGKIPEFRDFEEKNPKIPGMK